MLDNINIKESSHQTMKILKHLHVNYSGTYLAAFYFYLNFVMFQLFVVLITFFLLSSNLSLGTADRVSGTNVNV